MKKKLLLMAVCCLTIASLAACGNDTNTTDATVTDTPAPTEAVVDDTTDNTDATVTEAPVVTEPTAAPEETVTEAPTPTEAPKELTVAEQYAENYPFMEYELFDNVTIDDTMNDIQTGYVLYIKNNSDEPYQSGYGVLKPGVGIYARDFASDYDTAMNLLYGEYGDVYATTDVSSYLREDELQKCEDTNCLFTSYGESSLTYEYYYIILFNADEKPVYYLRGDNAYKLVTNVDNQLHVDVSGFSDVDWTTAKIVYEVTE